MLRSERKSFSRSRFLQGTQSEFKLKDLHLDLIHQIIESVTRRENCMIPMARFELQSKIDWKYALRGFLTSEWEPVMLILRPKYKWTETTGAMISIIWKIWKEMWIHHNKSIDPSARYISQMQSNNNILTLQIIYSLCQNFPARLQRVLDPNLEAHCLMPQQ